LKALTAGMTVKRAVIAAIVGQFGHPRGTAGSVVGWVMAHRPSNRQRNRWVVSLLDVQPAHRVLEIGFGPRLAIAELSRRRRHRTRVRHRPLRRHAPSGGQAHATAIAAGRVSLSLAPVNRLPPALSGPFDAIFSVNSVGFWPAPAERLGELRQRLRPGGCVAIASQPRCGGATASTSRDAARRIEALLQEAGYAKARTETLDLDPPVVCVLAVNPGPLAGKPGR
jgi:SAM-dependent methyltransferase